MLRMAQKQNSEKCSNNAGNTQEMQCLEPTQINESTYKNVENCKDNALVINTGYFATGCLIITGTLLVGLREN